MNFLDTIHQGDVEAVRQQLVERPELLNQTDAQGNTPLHYAVASHHLALIEFLIYPNEDDGKEAADVSVKNQQGETAAQWYEELIVSLHSSGKPFSSKELRKIIEANDVPIIKEYLEGILSPSLRFSRGSTLLHWAVELQRPTIVKLILDGITQENINRLLNLKDSRGRTPVALAEQFYHYGTPTAREIFHSLQEKQHATIPEEINSRDEPLPLVWPLAMNQEFMDRIKQLSERLKQPITPADFQSLNPMREVICQLAYITCYRALSQLSSLINKAESFSKKMLLQDLLRILFGSWSTENQIGFFRKIEITASYLANLIIKQQQVEQVIHFSDKKEEAKGWSRPAENKIYLNPTGKTNLTELVTVLIHEATHIATQSYDFATMDFCVDRKIYFFDLDNVCQLASMGIEGKLTPEKAKLFELRQLLQEGNSPDWQEHLKHWKALNNADTQTLAILLLAALPEGYAQFDKKQNTLLIKKQFLSTAYLKKHPTPPPLLTPYWSPVTEPPAGIAPPSSDDPPGLPRTEPTRRSFSNWFLPCSNPEKEPPEIVVQSELSRSGSANRSVRKKFVDLLIKRKQEGARVTGSQSPSSDQDEGMCDSLSRSLSPPTQLSQAMASTSFSTPSTLPLAVSSPPQRLSFVGSIRDNDSDDTE
jgi:ankyrin repeat protein